MNLIILFCGVVLLSYITFRLYRSKQHKNTLENYVVLSSKLYFSDFKLEDSEPTMFYKRYGSLLFEVTQKETKVEKIKIKKIRFAKPSFGALHFSSLIIDFNESKKEVMRSVSISCPRNYTPSSSPFPIWLSGKVYLKNGQRKVFTYRILPEVLDLKAQDSAPNEE